jgi:hypothetical protein
MDLALTCLALAFFLIQLIHHQMWRDELNVFGIVQASPTLSLLFQHLHYEGHPAVWYLLVWIAAHWLPTAAVLRAVQACVGIAILSLIGLASPFTRTEKALLFASYFVSFEYTVLSRTYGVCFLACLVYLWIRFRVPHNVLVHALILGVLANTDVIGCFLSLGFVCQYAIAAFRNKQAYFDRKYLIAAATYLLLVGICVWCVWPARDTSWRTTGHIFARAGDFRHYISAAVNYLVMPFFPIATDHYPARFWNPLALQHPTFYTLCLPPIVGAYWLVFRRDRDLLAMFAVVALLGIGFASFVFMGNMRNFGVTFTAFVAALWMQRGRGITRLPRAATALLVLSGTGGALAAAAQWTHPFSNAETAARWLENSPWSDAVLIGTPDTSLASLAELLGKPVYMLDCRCSDTYLWFSRRRDNFDARTMPEDIAEAVARTKAGRKLLVLVEPITNGQVQRLTKLNLRVEPVARFTGAEVWQEDYFLYEITTEGR